MQQHLIAHNYPGLLDALTPVSYFPDSCRDPADMVDCGILNHYFDAIANPGRLAAAGGGSTAIRVRPQGATKCTGQNGLRVSGPVPRRVRCGGAV